MKFMVTADTDIGTCREANQDSLLSRHIRMPAGEVLLCVICDGMGGLSRGELASATVVRAFSEWFDRELSAEKAVPDLRRVAARWEALLRDLNREIARFGEREQIHLGTTFSGILFAGGRYLICHVGDSRIYHFGGRAEQLTEDQTIAEREFRAGRLTAAQAKTDEKRNILLQCVGASLSLKPQIILRRAKPGVYLLCSDGLCHEMSEEEMRRELCPGKLVDRKGMHSRARSLIDLAKSRGEADNISALVVRAQGRPDRHAGRQRG